MEFDVIERKLTHHVCDPDNFGFSYGLLDAPLVDAQPFNQPHAACSVRRRAVNVNRLIGRIYDCLQESFH